MDRLSQLQILVAVVETGSITAAAERLGQAKSGVSRGLAMLERRLGVRLLQRSTRRLSLTEAGRALYVQAGRLLHDLDEAEQGVAAAQAALQGPLKLAAPLSFGLRQLSPLLAEFLAAHPGVVLEVDLNDRQVDLVEEGFDLALRIGQLADSSLIARRLATVTRVTCASPDYLARHGRPRHPQDMAGHQGLRYTHVSRQRHWCYRDAQGRSLTPTVPDRLCANNGDLLLAAARSGLGVLASPGFIVGEAIAAGELTRLLADYAMPGATVYAVYPPGRFPSRRLRALVDFLALRLADAPWDRGLGGLAAPAD